MAKDKKLPAKKTSTNALVKIAVGFKKILFEDRQRVQKHLA